MSQIAQDRQTDDDNGSNPYAEIEMALREDRDKYAVRNPPCDKWYPETEKCNCVSCEAYRGTWSRDAYCDGQYCGCDWCVVDADIADERACARFEAEYNATT